MHQRLRLSVLAAFCCLPAVAAAAPQCGAGTSPARITGRVTTLNISPTKQAGQICLTLTTADGREVFDDCGALIGKITSTDANTGASTLNHTAVFERNEWFHTVNDVALVTGVLETDADGIPCAMSVQEHLTKIQSGTGIFSNATIDVFADGTISFCAGKNLNNFQLSGQGCVTNKRR